MKMDMDMSDGIDCALQRLYVIFRATIIVVKRT